MELMMDIIKKKRKKVSNVVSVYFNNKDMEALEFLREKDVNISMVCRQAIRETAQKLIKGGDESDKQDKLKVKCNGRVIINMEENLITFENQKPFITEDELKLK
jgi:hypothetical protein